MNRKNQDSLATLAKLYRAVSDTHLTLAHAACEESAPHDVEHHIRESRTAHMKAERILRTLAIPANLAGVVE